MIVSGRRPINQRAGGRILRGAPEQGQFRRYFSRKSTYFAEAGLRRWRGTTLEAGDGVPLRPIQAGPGADTNCQVPARIRGWLFEFVAGPSWIRGGL